MSNIINIYANGAAGNHGCEALSRSYAKLFKDGLRIASLDPAEDTEYGLDQIARIVPLTNSLNKSSLSYLLYRIQQHIHYSDRNYYRLIYRDYLNKINSGELYISAGGDNYSYGKNDWLEYLNKRINQKGGITALVGCSLKEDLDQSFDIDDLARYKFIITRESISFNALKSFGVKTEAYCIPDPAFLLDKATPKFDVNCNTVGINVSPMVIERQNNDGLVLSNYIHLIKYILQETDMNVALIPHVVWNVNDDRVPLNALYNAFSNHEQERITLISDQNAEQVKGAISHCRFLIAARTHASIAAYSTCVPTLVIGYSVKARGIATDIFGASDNFVLPVQSITNSKELLNKFTWLLNNEDNIRNHYDQMMQSYIDRVYEISDIVHHNGF